MKVLVVGATGFAGFPAARALARAGHLVYGLVRSAEKGKKLAAEEIIPIVGDALDPTPWLPIVAELDTVIDAVGGAVDLKAIGSSLLSAVAEAAQKYRPHDAPKLNYIYTSGTWVHGENRSNVVTDTTPLTSPTPLVAWRPAHERAVINNPILNGIVIRPALIYGRSASILATLFKNAYNGKVSWYGTPGGRYALIHVDDLAELYVLTAERATIAAGKIFDAANDFTESADDLLNKLVLISGAKGPYEYVEPSNLFESAITTTTLIRPYLARSVLGWQPRKAGLVDFLEVYYNAWKANEGLLTFTLTLVP
ncbi:unnamed protein product [Somion occarium]|uniref:NAD-dependent epimerase/dehydratase domain-containing protein n=1 Tax=Somion occarium TaxID=3059160 RepID=A0ABP1DXX1_9APHY